MDALLQPIAAAIDAELNPRMVPLERSTGFVLMVFPFGKHSPGDVHQCSFVSNARREDVALLLEEQAKIFRAQIEKDRATLS